jgi:hypothetical protein
MTDQTRILTAESDIPVHPIIARDKFVPTQANLLEARVLVDAAIKREPWLTSFGIFSRRSRETQEAVADRFAKEQEALYRADSLLMVAHSAAWIKTRKLRKTFNRTSTSYSHKHLVEAARRRDGDPDPYVYNGAFMAAAIGLRLDYEIDSPNAVFKLGVSDVR